jgi:aspartate oxidase
VWDGVGIERDPQGLADARAWLAEALREVPPGSRIAQRLRVAEAIAAAAVARPQSLGAHCRIDSEAERHSA